MATFNFFRWQPSPVPAIFEGLHYPPPQETLPQVSTPDFYQNDGKECTWYCLDGLGHFPFGFGATGKNSRGGGKHPP